MARRAIVIVLDGCGAGAAPDADLFGDSHGPNTLRHVWEKNGGINAPNLERLGFFDESHRIQELSMGKDSVTGHWEMMGIVTTEPFPTYPDGFPIALIKEFEERIGLQTLGNCSASGTEIINRLGPQHMETGCPIVYTSADSVFQIAAHEEVVPLADLYRCCEIAREMLVKPNNVQRVIARPFVGSEKGGFSRTPHRKDYPLVAEHNLIDDLGETFGIGVIPELFGGRGFLPVRRTQNNAEHGEMLYQALETDAQFIFANFEDTDMLFGHRNDPIGFAKCLEQFDAFLGDFLNRLTPNEDLLLITADHGNDPTDASTDHTREYVPIALWGAERATQGDVLGMDAIGRTVATWLGTPWNYREAAKSLI